MIQSIYTSVSDADLVPCGKKGLHITSKPIPLLRDKYLGEYRTELERAKVRKNLGILDDQVIEWKNIKGYIEDNPELTKFVTYYSNSNFEELTTIREALDYTLLFVTTFETDTESIKKLKQDVIDINNSIEELETKLSKDIKKNSDDIINIQEDIVSINSNISKINDLIKNIDVDKNILNWVNNKLQGSKTLELRGDQTLEVTIADTEDNAITVLSEIINPDDDSIEPVTKYIPGLYVKDLEPTLTEVKSTVDKHDDTIENMSKEIDVLDLYQTLLSDLTVSTESIGGIEAGTTVESLKGKTITQILDQILFPTVIRDLVLPELHYNISYLLVEVNTPSLNPQLEFIQNDAGSETDRTETITFNTSEVLEHLDTYLKLGTYVYKGIVEYEAGLYLTDNKGEITEKRIEAGSITTECIIDTTYPWYVGNTSHTEKQELVKFNLQSQDFEITLSGKAVIKLPGKNSKLNSFKVNGGLGFLDVDMRGWKETTDIIEGYTYKVWTKTDEYPSILPHKIKFTLSE